VADRSLITKGISFESEISRDLQQVFFVLRRNWQPRGRLPDDTRRHLCGPSSAHCYPEVAACFESCEEIQSLDQRSTGQHRGAAPPPRDKIFNKMPSQRRLRLLFLVVMALLISVLFFSSKLRQSSEPDTRTLQDFYHKTLNAMDRGRAGGQTVLGAKKGKISSPPVDHDADGDIDEDDAALARDMQSRLKAAEQKAKDLANAKAPNKPDSPNEIVGIGSSAGGQAPRVGPAGDSGAAIADPKGTAEAREETDEEHQTELELNRILKKSPGMFVLFTVPLLNHVLHLTDYRH
jgi:hypothetical protein